MRLAPNPSIERTLQRPLRARWPAAHVERYHRMQAMVRPHSPKRRPRSSPHERVIAASVEPSFAPTSWQT